MSPGDAAPDDDALARPADSCPHCGATVAVQRIVPQRGDVPARERATCPSCGLQLVRRAGEPWDGIRG